MDRSARRLSCRKWLSAPVLCLALGAAHQAGAQPNALLSQADVSPADMRQASALVEKYLLPVEPQEPTSEQKRLIASATKLLKTEQANNGQTAIERFVKVGPAAIGSLRDMESPTSATEINEAELLNPNAALPQPPAQFAAMLAPLIVRRIEAAQRQPIVAELAALGAAGQTALQLKLLDAQVELATLQARADAAAAAKDAEALATAKAAAESLSTRVDMLLDLKRLLAPAPKPAPVQPPEAAASMAPTQQLAPSLVLSIQPLNPPSSNTGWYPTLDNNGSWLPIQVADGWFVWAPPVIYPGPRPPFIINPPLPPSRPHPRDKRTTE